MSVYGFDDLFPEDDGRMENEGDFELTKQSRITVLSGAGISAESEIPTFRGPDGLWSDENLVKIATPRGFLADPVRGWKFYDERRQNMAGSRPNPAHRALAVMENAGYDVVVITQNIDRLHQRAGSGRVIELHGSVWEFKCSNPLCRLEPFVNEEAPIRIIPPKCELCGSVLRPNVVFFEEMLDPGVIEDANLRTRNSDLFLVIGTSGVVYPAAGFVPLAKAAGAYLIEMNIEMTPLSSICDMVMLGKCGETLPKLFAELTSGEVEFS